MEADSSLLSGSERVGFPLRLPVLFQMKIQQVCFFFLTRKFHETESSFIREHRLIQKKQKLLGGNACFVSLLSKFR